MLSGTLPWPTNVMNLFCGPKMDFYISVSSRGHAGNAGHESADIATYLGTDCYVPSFSPTRDFFDAALVERSSLPFSYRRKFARRFLPSLSRGGLLLFPAGR